MITFENLNEIEIPGKTAIALGNFNGVHLGHRKLISEMVDYGRENNLKTLVFTFSNHPRDLLPDATKKKNILHRNEKSGIIESLGVDYLVNVPFTKEIMNTACRKSASACGNGRSGAGSAVPVRCNPCQAPPAASRYCPPRPPFSGCLPSPDRSAASSWPAACRSGLTCRTRRTDSI